MPHKNNLRVLNPRVEQYFSNNKSTIKNTFRKDTCVTANTFPNPTRKLALFHTNVFTLDKNAKNIGRITY